MKKQGVAYVSVQNDGGEAAISLPIFNYGNYCAADENDAPFAITSGENMRIVLTIPAGLHRHDPCPVPRPRVLARV